MGAVVDEVAVYHTRAVTESKDLLITRLKGGQVDLVTFTSSSTVRNFKALLPKDQAETLLKGVTIASIGPITTQTAMDLGMDVHITAETYTIDGLVEAILTYDAGKSHDHL